MKKNLFTLLIFLPAFIFGQAPVPDSTKLKMDFCLLDIPYQADAAITVEGQASLKGILKAYANPGMQQSLSLTSSLFSACHRGIDQAIRINNNSTKGRRLLHDFSILTADYLLFYLPGGSGWLHEEYHRAVMSRFHVNSFNDMNTFPIGQEIVSVNSVTDEDLIRFKLESPQDFIRMHVAGIEGEYLLLDKLQKENFFYGQGLNHEFIYLLTTINAINYVGLCSVPGFVDEETDRMNNMEYSISERDFTGFDFAAWTYDLFNPDEPYTERGIHPTGTGIDRYIKTSDLNQEQLKYLSRQGRLQFINLLSPMLYWKKTIQVNEDLSCNFSFRHLLTSFGNDISLKVLLKKCHYGFVFGYHHASNYVKGFPALEAELFEYPINLRNQHFLISPGVILGLQPIDQSFLSTESAFLGKAGCRVDWLTSKIHPYLVFDMKTNGWIAGNEFLTKRIILSGGISARL